jgi:hypothetical protein
MTSGAGDGWDDETAAEFEREFDHGWTESRRPDPIEPLDGIDDIRDLDEIDDLDDLRDVDDLPDLDEPEVDDEPDDDLGDEDEEPELPGPRAAYAVNWKTVLGVDAAMGLIVVAGGFVAMVTWNVAIGAALSGLGLFYVALVVRRGRGWQQLRRDAGM